MRRYLIVKLLAVNLLVIGFVMVFVWIAIDTLAASYFMTLMEKYHVSPEPAHDMFVEAIHRYLLGASLAAVILAVILSYLMMRRVLSPLTQMTAISREIAAGNFILRVPAVSEDEVGQLAHAFNRMSASLEKIERLRRDLMIDVAHELRTPLTNIRGYLEALNDGVLPPSVETFAMLQSETLRIVQLVEDVLQLAKADAARESLTLEPVDVVQIIREQIQADQAIYDRRNIRVDPKLPGDAVMVPGDPHRLIRIFRNIGNNAARYTPRDSEVLVQVNVQGDMVRICYRNPVETLTQADVPYLFERFYRGEKSRSRRHGGAGIGLAIVKELVEAHHGRVEAVLRDTNLDICVALPLH